MGNSACGQEALEGKAICCNRSIDEAAAKGNEYQQGATTGESLEPNLQRPADTPITKAQENTPAQAVANSEQPLDAATAAPSNGAASNEDFLAAALTKPKEEAKPRDSKGKGPERRKYDTVSQGAGARATVGADTKSALVAGAGGSGRTTQSKSGRETLLSPKHGMENYFTTDGEREVKEAEGEAAEGEEKPKFLQFTAGHKYTGQFKDDEDGRPVRHGTGKMVWENGAEYAGEWVDDQAHGKGRFQHTDGDIYIGDWAQNCAEGKGVYYTKNQGGGSPSYVMYEGTFNDDLLNGMGVERWPEGSRYDGWFENGRKHGHGSYAWKDGAKYYGQWNANKIHGFGEYVGGDGRRYKGQWSKSLMNGKGVYMWTDGRRYEGDYVSDKKQGFGIFTWPDGRKYEGYWDDGRQHGTGIYYFADGTTRRSEWANGKRTKWLDDEAK